MRELLCLVLMIAFLLQGCATYNYKKDPAYQAYLRGELTYAEYLEDYRQRMAAHRAKWHAISDACGRLAETNRRANEGVIYPQSPTIYPTNKSGEQVIYDNDGNRVGTIKQRGRRGGEILKFE